MNQHENSFIEHVSPLKGYSCTHEVHQNLFSHLLDIHIVLTEQPLKNSSQIKRVFEVLKQPQDGKREMAFFENFTEHLNK